MASGLKSELEREFTGVIVELIKGYGGMFEVTVDGRLAFSKKELERFPEKGEVGKLIHSAQSNSP